MWICFNDGFVSAVEDRADFDGLVIRSRRKDILVELFGEDEVITNAPGSSDYKYRVFTTKKKYAEIVYNRILNIEYDNFKNSVGDRDLHDLYAGFWYDHYRYQR